MANIEKLKKAYEEALLVYEKADEAYNRASELDWEAWKEYSKARKKHQNKRTLIKTDEAYNRAQELKNEALNVYYKAKEKYQKAWEAYRKATAKKG